MVEAILGEGARGVLCCDGYAAYHHYPGRKQRCWTHLLRDLHDLTTAHPTDARPRRWAGRVRQLYAEAVAFRHAEARVRVAAQRRFEQRLARLCRRYADDPTAVQGTLCRTILRHLPERFVFVAEPAVPPDNNAAERSLRHLVTARKISGGTRSPWAPPPGWRSPPSSAPPAPAARTPSSPPPHSSPPANSEQLRPHIPDAVLRPAAAADTGAHRRQGREPRGGVGGSGRSDGVRAQVGRARHRAKPEAFGAPVDAMVEL
jgi:hypothetical protein